jgi:hypothetical protein
MDEAKDEARIDSIIEGLTTEFYSHVHAISRREAQTLLGDWVVAPEAGLADLIQNLLSLYTEDLKLNEKFSVPAEIGENPTMQAQLVAGYLETSQKSYICRTDVTISQRLNVPQGIPMPMQPGGSVTLPPGPRAYDFSIGKLGWVENDSGL